MQFSRVITFVKDIQVWNATSDGFSFVICFASRSGPGFHGNPGFLASWRPIDQNRTAVKVIGSPFKTLPEAEKACEAVLGHLKEPSGVKRRSYSHASALRAVARSSGSVESCGTVHPSPGRDRLTAERKLNLRAIWRAFVLFGIFRRVSASARAGFAMRFQ